MVVNTFSCPGKRLYSIRIWITFILDECQWSWASESTVAYERDMQWCFDNGANRENNGTVEIGLPLVDHDGGDTSLLDHGMQQLMVSYKTEQEQSETD